MEPYNPESLCFSREEVLCFSRLSGDFNPIHTNIEASKLLGFHETIVHGALVSTAVISRLSEHRIGDIAALHARFYYPIFTGYRYQLSFDGSSRGLRITRGDKTCAEIYVTYKCKSWLHGNMTEYSAEDGCQEGFLNGDSAWTKWEISVKDVECLAAFGNYNNTVLPWLEILAAISYVAGTLDPGPYGLIRDFQVRRHRREEAAMQETRIRRLRYDTLGNDNSTLVVSGYSISGKKEFDAQFIATRRAVFSSLPESLNYEFGAKIPGGILVVGASRGLGASLALLAAQRAELSVGLYKCAVKAALSIENTAKEHKLPLRMYQVDCTKEHEFALLLDKLFGEGVQIKHMFLTAFPEESMAIEPEEFYRTALTLATLPIELLAKREPKWSGVITYVSSALVDAGRGQHHAYREAKRQCELSVSTAMSALPKAGLLVARLPMFLSDRTALLGSLRELPSARDAGLKLLQAADGINKGERKCERLWSLTI